MNLIPCTAQILELAKGLQQSAAPSDIGAAHLVEGCAWALVDGGYLLGVGGVSPYWDGRWMAWMFATRFARPRHVVKGLRFGREWFDRLQQNPLFRRVEISVRADQPFCASMAAALGFGTPEALMRGWGPDGADYWLYARVR